MSAPSTISGPTPEAEDSATGAKASRRRLAALFYLLVTAAALAPPAAILARSRTMSWRDTERLMAPLRPMIVDALRDLRLPLWNSHEALGQPLFAQMMHSVLHPVSMVAAAVAPNAGMDLVIVLDLVLAALGAAVAARQLAVGWPAAFVAACAYALSGYVLGMSNNALFLTAAATAPWTIAALRASARGGRRGIGIAALAVAALHLAGEPQWTIAAVGLGGVLAAVAGGRTGLLRAAAGAALGSVVAAVQLAPAWQQLQESVRSEGLIAVVRSQWALAPWRILELFAPGFFCGTPGETLVAPVYRWLGGPETRHLGYPFVPSVFVGALVLVLAVRGVTRARDGLALAIAAAAFLWMALGPSLGAEQLLGGVPIWGSFRYAEKLVGPFTLCVALLAALGTERLARSAPGRGHLALATALAAACLGGAALLAAGAAPPWPAADGAGDALPLAAERLRWGLLHAGIPVALYAALLAAARRSSAVARGAPAVAAGLVFAAAAAASPYSLRSGAAHVRDPAPLRILRSPDPVRIATPISNYAPPEVARGLDEFDEALDGESRMALPPFNAASGIDQLEAYSGLAPRAQRAVMQTFGREFGPANAWVALRRFSITHVVVRQPLTSSEQEVARAATSEAEPLLDDPGRHIRVFGVPHRPWAFFATSSVPVQPGEDALAGLVASLERGSDAVLVEGPATPRPAEGRVLRFERESERLRVEGVTAAEGLLVVNDAFWPGWSAWIDGRPVPVWRADALVRAIPWPAGRHVLEMRYEPGAVRVGWGLSAAGLAAVVALLVRRRRGRGGEPA